MEKVGKTSFKSSKYINRKSFRFHRFGKSAFRIQSVPRLIAEMRNAKLCFVCTRNDVVRVVQLSFGIWTFQKMNRKREESVTWNEKYEKVWKNIVEEKMRERRTRVWLKCNLGMVICLWRINEYANDEFNNFYIYRNFVSICFFYLYTFSFLLVHHIPNKIEKRWIGSRHECLFDKESQ